MAKEDLIPIRSTEEAKKRGAAGGRKSGEVRRNKALLRDCINILMERKVIDEETGKRLTGAEQLSINLFKKALEETDTAKAAKAFEVLRDSSGQKPTEKIEQTNTNIEIDFGDLDED